LPTITEEVETALNKLVGRNLETISSAEELGKIVGYTNEEFFNFTKQADLTGDVIQQYKDYINSTSTSTSKFASTLKSAAANMAIMLAINAGIKLIAWTYDQVAHRQEILNNAAIESVNAFKEVESQIDSTNSELKTTENRINELEGKPSLSFVEQEELRKLREANEGLNRSVKLLEAKEKVAGEEDCEKHCINHIRKFRNNKELMVDSNMTYRVFFCSDLL
jgi:hypothetical protein